MQGLPQFAKNGTAKQNSDGVTEWDEGIMHRVAGMTIKYNKQCYSLMTVYWMVNPNIVSRLKNEASSNSRWMWAEAQEMRRTTVMSE